MLCSLLVKDIKKATTAQRAEDAISFLSKNTSCTYEEASALFNVSIHSIRARVNHRYTSLSAMRSGYERVDDQKARRKCKSCGKVLMLTKNRRYCAKCTRY